MKRMLELTFWGVRGSFPVSGVRYNQGGGDTSCVGVVVNQNQLIVFDAGSGLNDLSQKLSLLPLKTMHIFLSHLHLDHIMGLPFFKPLSDKEYTINFYSTCETLKEFLENTLFHPTLFPKKLASYEAKIIFHHFSTGHNIRIGHNILMKTCLLNHPGGAVGYRLEAEGKSICYITDVEHNPNQFDQALIDFIEGSNIFIYDSSYTEEEFRKKRGWGHSTHIRAAELAKMANVNQLALFHHSPTHTDALLQQIELEAKAIFDNAFVARQGLKVLL